jgi:Cu/Ag efflux protein CusF
MKSSKNRMMAVSAAVLVCLTTVVMAQEASKAAPPKGEAVMATVELTAQVMAINYETREVTLKMENGQPLTIVADEAVKNLDQVMKGDVVVATYTQALAYEVKKGGTTGVSSTAAAAKAEPGEKPAAIVGQSLTVTVEITAIDKEAPSVTVKGPGGETKTVMVKDPRKLEGVSVGDTVDLTYVETVALSVEKAPK